MTAYIIILVGLMGYIVILHFQLSKKNLLIKSISEELSLSKKNIENKVYISKQLNKVQNGNNNKLIKEDHFLHDHVQSYLFDKEEEVKLFIHYTKEENTAKQILDEGFQFADSFHKTTVPLINDKAILAYQHNVNKCFGNFIIIISISKKIYNYYSSELIKNRNVNSTTEQILTEVSPVENNDLEYIYTFPKHYIKGYLNYSTGEIITNPNFNPNYDSPTFKENLEQIINSESNI